MSVQRAAHISPIPSAPFGDLELDRDEDEEEWERRVMQVAADRIQAARTRLEAMGIIDADGKRLSSELPPDMTPGSDATLETG
jgi:gamma-glutamyl:cysteine ligase YbdK (ATP-grasp superfamily)